MIKLITLERNSGFFVLDEFLTEINYFRLKKIGSNKTLMASIGVRKIFERNILYCLCPNDPIKEFQFRAGSDLPF